MHVLNDETVRNVKLAKEVKYSEWKGETRET